MIDLEIFVINALCQAFNIGLYEKLEFDDYLTKKNGKRVNKRVRVWLMKIIMKATKNSENMKTVEYWRALAFTQRS